MNLDTYVRAAFSIVEDEYPLLLSEILNLIGNETVLLEIDSEKIALSVEKRIIVVSN